MTSVLRTVCAIALAIGISGAPAAYAHTEESDGPIQAVLHIEPSHEPTAGEAAHIEFFMGTTMGEFNAASYTYELLIGTDEASSTAVTVTAEGSTLRADYTFPQTGTYTATLSGRSNGVDVPAFTLDFDDIQVLPPSEHENMIKDLYQSHGAHLILVGVLVLILVGVVLWEKVIGPRLIKKS